MNTIWIIIIYLVGYAACLFWLLRLEKSNEGYITIGRIIAACLISLFSWLMVGCGLMMGALIWIFCNKYLDKIFSKVNKFLSRKI